MQHLRPAPVVLLLSAALGLGACQAEQNVYIEATLRGDHTEATEYGTHLLVRAVPDHRNGFVPSRVYLGDRVYDDGCPLDHVELPLDFALFGSDEHVKGAPDRWLLLAWVTDDPNATWVAPGELYGTTTFEFHHDNYFGYWVDGLVVDLEAVRDAQ